MAIIILVASLHNYLVESCEKKSVFFIYILKIIRVKLEPPQKKKKKEQESLQLPMYEMK